MKKDGRYRHADDEHEGGKAREQSQYQQERAEYFREEHQDQGDLMTDVKGIEKNGCLGIEMGQFGKAMVDADDQSEDQSKQEGCKIEAVLGIGSGKEFLHVNWN